MQKRNLLIFVVVMLGVLAGWLALKTWLAPPATPAPPPPLAFLAAGAAGLGAGPDGEALLLSLPAVALACPPDAAPSPPPTPPPDAPPVAPPVVRRTPTPDDQLIWIGAPGQDSKYHMHVALDKRGGGVRRLILNKFKGAGPDGRPLLGPDGKPLPLELIPDDPYSPSFLLYLYDVADFKNDRPLDALGVVDWTVAARSAPEDEDGGQSVTFTAESQGVRVTKKYTLKPGEYHLGLEVTLASADGKPKPNVRYQFAGPHGLPVEGRWYTGIFRNALIGQVNAANSVDREFQDLRQITAQEGGKEVLKKTDEWFRYAGVALQYFASVVVVAEEQPSALGQQFIAKVRPTLEIGVTRGLLTSVADDQTSFKLMRDDGSEQKYRVPPDERLRQDHATFTGRLHSNTRVAVVHTSESYDAKHDDHPLVALALHDYAEGPTRQLWEGDVTVRLTTEPVELKADEPVTHKYLLYNGPVKTLMLRQPDASAMAVRDGLVDEYDHLSLKTLADYRSNSPFGTIAEYSGLNTVLFTITNWMHWVLYFLHYYLIPNYILCIIGLTILVRGMMFPLSRKTALMSIRMQALAPELKKLGEKYKDDKPALAAEQMALYRKHGVNPFGTCWVLLLQMPIFMGLYYCLQESVHFRLTSLSSWWIPNLSAPDMLAWWSEYIPYLSEPAWYGWLFYLGPYLNVLPIVAVSLMMIQQKLTMPPPTDEQQEQQQKMMKYMVAFMGVMFYKVAAGLCIYFIASNLWGFAERKMLPKKKKPGEEPLPETDAKATEGYFQKLLRAARSGVTADKPQPATAGIALGPRGDGRRKGRKKRRADGSRTAPNGAAKNDGSMMARLRAWWVNLLEEARKK
jgi:YidC/Oxa1 family membrane protein insertase